MRVVATQMGQYNQTIREVGEVFDLLTFPDGTYPHKTKEVPKLDADGKPTGEFTLKVIKLKDGKTPAHRDFAPDQGVRQIKSGPMKGETVQLGWMRLVSDKVPVGIYPPGTDFWSNTQLPQPWVVPIGQQDRRASPIRMHLDTAVQPDIEELEDL